jgi:hypothetical protein
MRRGRRRHVIVLVLFILLVIVEVIEFCESEE